MSMVRLPMTVRVYVLVSITPMLLLLLVVPTVLTSKRLSGMYSGVRTRILLMLWW